MTVEFIIRDAEGKVWQRGRCLPDHVPEPLEGHVLTVLETEAVEAPGQITPPHPAAPALLVEEARAYLAAPEFGHGDLPLLALEMDRHGLDAWQAAQLVLNLRAIEAAAIAAYERARLIA